MEGGSVGSVSSLHSLSSARSTPIPATFKPLTPCASLLALSNKSDDELRHRSSEQLLSIIHRFEKEYRSVITEHSTMMKDVNKKVQILLIETKGMKDINQSLQDDNQELRDLCCFLDDDRQRGRKLAREWQRFGRYTASVMRSEVSVYQEKLKELELRQQELISDNIELKELCLYLDQERLRISNQTRDEGDGSSSSTLAGNDDHPLNDGIDLVPVSQLCSAGDAAMGNSAEPSEYIQHLEEKIRKLEGNKGSSTEVSGGQRLGPDGIHSPETVSAGASLNKPEAVVHAMKVLEVHENLERPAVAVGEDNLDDKEKAIVREMCNVVWRKLGNVSAENAEDSESSTPHPVYENLHPASNNLPPEGASNSSHPRVMYPAPSISQHGPVVSSSGVRSSSAQQSSDNVRQAEYHPHPGYGQTDSYRARSASPGPQPPPYDKRSPPAYPGRGVNNSNQSYNQQGQYGGKPGKTGPPNQENVPPKYAYVRMSRSTPVTPTPSQHSEAIYPQPGAASTPAPKTQIVRSHSPGPNNVAHRPEVQRSHSPGAYTGRQMAPQLTDTHNVYQNHPPPGSKRDNSYENIPVGPGPTFTSTPSSSGHTAQQQYKINNPLKQSGDYSRQRDESHDQSNYMYSGPARDVPPSPALYRSSNQPAPEYQQLRSSQGYQEQGPPLPVHYQKAQGQVPQSSAGSSSIPQSSYSTQQRPLPPYPSQQSGTSASLAYNKTGGGPTYTGDRRPNQSSNKPGNQPYMYRQDAGNQMYSSRQNEGVSYNNSRLEQENQQYINRPESGNQHGQNRQNHGNQQQNYRQEYGNQMYSSRQLSGNQQGNPRQNTGNQMYSQERAPRDQFYRN